MSVIMEISEYENIEIFNKLKDLGKLMKSNKLNTIDYKISNLYFQNLVYK